MKIFAIVALLCNVLFVFDCRKQQTNSAQSVAVSQKRKVDPNGPEVDCALYPKQDKSPYVLPYQVGKSFLVWRTTSHYAKGNGGVGLYAVDFEMPVGTPVVAARAGKVVAARGEFYDGNNEDLKENFVFVKHEDGTIGRYFHLTHDGAKVKVGDSVKQGDVIGLSGNTGQSPAPHLHFDVQKCGPNLPPKYNELPCGQTLPVTFRNTSESECGPVPGERYVAQRYR